MIWFGLTPLKKFPTPILRPMAPFFAAGAVVMYGINSVQTAMMKSPEWRDHPDNWLREKKT